MNNKTLTPRQIVEKLDQYIVGQEEAKRSVAIAVRGRWRRGNAQIDIREEITPNNILMKGSTGTGKTEIARRLAKLSDSPFVKVEATQYTERGYHGGDAENMIHALVNKAIVMVKKEKQRTVKEKAEKIVEDIILDILIPPLNDGKEEKEVQLNASTRERFREKIRNKELDHRMIEIKVKESISGAGIMTGGQGNEATMLSITNMLNKFMPQKEQNRKVTIKEAKKMLLEEQYNRLIDQHKLKAEAVKKAEQGIVFIDEIDKIAGGATKRNGAMVSREGAQRDLLPIVEGTVINTKIGPIKTDYILFIGAGAFHESQPADLMPELLGRFPIRVALDSLQQKDLEHILTKPKNSLIKQQQALFQAEGVELEFTPEAITEMARISASINQQKEDIGARRLRTVMVQVLSSYLFDIPDKMPANKKISIDQSLVKERLSKLLEERDDMDYII